MALTVENSGTQAAVISTEHSLATVTGAKVLVFAVDTNAMVNADVLELRVKMKVLTGGTIRQTELGTYSNIQADPIKVSIPIPSPFSAEFTLKQTAGTGRSFDWSVMSL